ncbi:MAG: hypothetical protein ABI563_00760 [Specibacter sp.]
MKTRHIGNNWVPLLGLSLLFLVSGAISMVTERGNGAFSGIFVAGTLVIGAASAGWLFKHPSWWLAPRNHYLYLAGGTLLGVLLSALIPFLHGCGPWVVLGAAIGTYGKFERFRFLMTVGCAVGIAGLLAMVIHADVIGGAMHLISAGILAFAANKLYVLRHGSRRESQDSDPGFIGSFEEFDPEEALRP